MGYRSVHFRVTKSSQFEKELSIRLGALSVGASMWEMISLVSIPGNRGLGIQLEFSPG